MIIKQFKKQDIIITINWLIAKNKIWLLFKLKLQLIGIIESYR